MWEGYISKLALVSDLLFENWLFVVLYASTLLYFLKLDL
jgi:hypothetical protein